MQKCLSRKTNAYLKFKQQVVVSVNWSGCAVLPVNADGIHLKIIQLYEELAVDTESLF